VIDFTGGNRPGPILQFINNVCIGSDDDILDVDGTDMWIEGNIFMHVHRSGSPDSASAISGGNDGGGGTGSRRSATAIDPATDQITCGTHGFSTGQEVVATALLGNTFPAAIPALHDGGPYFARAVSTTVVKLYLTAADATADTNAVNFTGGLGTGVSLSLTALGAVSHITIVGNIFYDLDHAATAKEGNFYTFLNNTVIAQSNAGSQDSVTGVLNFGDDTYHESGGMYAEGNIIQSAQALARNYPGAGLGQTVVWNNNLFPVGMTWTGAGSGNTSADARLTDTAIPTPGPYNYQRVAAQIRQMAGPLPGSPAKGSGPNGTDQGAARPLGVSLSGAPVGTTNATNASITVGTRMSGNGIPGGSGAWQSGSGWTHYKWRLNGGAFSAETLNTTPITLSGLSNGVKVLDVVGRNDAGYYQDDPAFGPDARVSSVTWTVDSGYVPPPASPLVQISEVLAKNVDTLGFSGIFPDAIELRNVGTATADLSGWGAHRQFCDSLQIRHREWNFARARHAPRHLRQRERQHSLAENGLWAERHRRHPHADQVSRGRRRHRRRGRIWRAARGYIRRPARDRWRVGYVPPHAWRSQHCRRASRGREGEDQRVAGRRGGAFS
jgi:hypothetical protein